MSHPSTPEHEARDAATGVASKPHPACVGVETISIQRVQRHCAANSAIDDQRIAAHREQHIRGQLGAGIPTDIGGAGWQRVRDAQVLGLADVRTRVRDRDARWTATDPQPDFLTAHLEAIWTHRHEHGAGRAVGQLSVPDLEDENFIRARRVIAPSDCGQRLGAHRECRDNSFDGGLQRIAEDDRGDAVVERSGVGGRTIAENGDRHRLRRIPVE